MLWELDMQQKQLDIHSFSTPNWDCQPLSAVWDEEGGSKYLFKGTMKEFRLYEKE